MPDQVDEIRPPPSGYRDLGVVGHFDIAFAAVFFHIGQVDQVGFMGEKSPNGSSNLTNSPML